MVNDIFVYNKKMKEKIVSYQFVLLVLGIKPPQSLRQTRQMSTTELPSPVISYCVLVFPLLGQLFP